MPVTIVGNNTPTAGGVVYGDGTNYVSTSAGTAGQVLLSNGASAPSFGAVPTVNLATGVTGTLPVANGGTGATSLTANNVLLGNGTSAVQVVAPGSSGNVLTSNGTTWQSTAPAGGGSWIFLASANFPGNTTDIDITSGFSTTYDTYLIIFQNITAVGGNINLRIDYGSGFVASGYYYSVVNLQQGNTSQSFSGGGGGASRILLTTLTRATALNVYIQNRNGSATNKTIWWQGLANSSNGSSGHYVYGLGGQDNTTTAITGVRLTGDADFTTGSYFFYGLKKS